MSRVRYVNKKTGWVSIYESTSCYDPVTKTSRPKRTYIGYEDPVTKEFVPSSGKPGRRKRSQAENASENSDQTSGAGYYTEYKRALAELDRQRAENNTLKEQLEILKNQVDEMSHEIDTFINKIQAIRK